jgi:putative PIN family toxin of toxin-antitoxin system
VSKVVLDTNVLVAAFAARGLCEAVFELCLENQNLFICDFMLEELSDKLLKKIKLPTELVEEILELYAKNSRRVQPAVIDESSCRDPKDLPIIGTCQSAGAHYLVTGDKDLLILENWLDTQIVSPRAFYEEVSQR